MRFFSVVIVITTATAQAAGHFADPFGNSNLGAHDLDQQIARFLEEEEVEAGDNSTVDGYYVLGKKCNDVDKLCYPGLTCTQAPPLGKRCMPSKECVVPKIQAMEAKYDLKALREKLLPATGIDNTELVDLAVQVGEGKKVDATPMRDYVAHVQEALKEVNEEATALTRHCAYPERGQDGGRKLQIVETSYAGLHMEAGLLMDAVVSVFAAAALSNSTTPADALVTFTRLCGGVELGLGLEAAYIAGGLFSGGVQDLNCLTFAFDLDFGLGLTFGMAVGFGLNGNTFAEVTLGGGAGGGIGGSLCATFACG